ncbi:MAG: FxsA family protein [Pirellulaceae bacterium]|nr:FxsA family protein [Pirellulaceae bacterium]MDP7018489.1 FxsA family protein [Pirellulaceae bacterium]
MFARLLFLFVAVPLIELGLLLWLAELMGWQWSLALVIVTGVVGSALARAQGWKAYSEIQQRISAGSAPTEPIMDGLMILIAGCLLLTPGILTDVVGFSLLIPPCRRVYRIWLAAWIQRRFHIQVGPFGGPSPDAPKVDPLGPDNPAANRSGRVEIIDSHVVPNSEEVT